VAASAGHSKAFELIGADEWLRPDADPRTDRLDRDGQIHHRKGTVLARRLKLELGRRVAKGGSPGVKLVQATLAQRRVVHQPLHGKHFAERIGDRRAGGKHERAAGVFRVNKTGLHTEIPGSLRSVRVDAAQARHVRGEGELPKLLRLVDDDLVDADLREREQVILTRRQRLQPLLVAFLHALDAPARKPVLRIDAGEQFFKP
jgi:hypothetical protein